MRSSLDEYNVHWWMGNSLGSLCRLVNGKFTYHWFGWEVSGRFTVYFKANDLFYYSFQLRISIILLYLLSILLSTKEPYS